MNIKKVSIKITAVFVLLVSILNVLDMIYAAGYANAEDLITQVNIQSSATVSISTNAVSLKVTPSRNGTFGSTYRSESVKTPIDISVNTNSANSFNVQMTTASTSLTSGSNSIPTLPDACSEGCTSSSEYFLDKWGYSTDGTNYKPVSTTTNIKEIHTNTGSTADTTSVYFGMKLSGATPPGTYTGTLNFQVTATP